MKRENENNTSKNQRLNNMHTTTTKKIKRCSLFVFTFQLVGQLMSYLRCLCLFEYGGVQHMLCCVFVLFVFVLCFVSCVCGVQHMLCCVFCFVSLRLVLCALCMVVSNTCCVVFLFCLSSSCVPYVASFSELSIFGCPFSIL